MFTLKQYITILRPMYMAWEITFNQNQRTRTSREVCGLGIHILEFIFSKMQVVAENICLDIRLSSAGFSGQSANCDQSMMGQKIHAKYTTLCLYIKEDLLWKKINAKLNGYLLMQQIHIWYMLLSMMLTGNSLQADTGGGN